VNEVLHDGSKLSYPGGDRDRLLELLAVFLLLLAPTVFYFATGGTRGSDGDTSVVSLIPDMLMRVGWCALVPLLLTRRDTFDWKLPKSGREWGKEFGWGLLLVLAVVGCGALMGLIVGLSGLEDPTGLSESKWNTSTMLAFLMFTPLIGMEEELLFRVYFQTRLTQVVRSKRVLPVFIASGLFAAVHGYSVAGTLMILVFGLVLGASYQANRKIPRLVIAHTLWNIGVTVLGLL
jgi:membrane protease YdiL (CAAX protease family)